MSVSPTSPVSIFTPTATPSTTGSSATSATVNYNQFLQLLVAELKNQDPTSPNDPTQYMSQLASFSAVGQQIQTNTTLGAMLTSQSLTQAEKMVGKQVTSADGKTTGIINSVSLSNTGAIQATLSNGTVVALTSGSSQGTWTTLSDGNSFNLPVGVSFGTTSSSPSSSSSSSSS